jgi:hypothetical protein
MVATTIVTATGVPAHVDPTGDDVASRVSRNPEKSVVADHLVSSTVRPSGLATNRPAIDDGDHG